MKKIAFMFTGQGSQVQGMGIDFYEKYPCSRNVFEKFNEITERKISDIAFSGSEEELKLTENSQPCILATEIAILEAFMNKIGLRANFVAGHSLGEYAALYAAKVINLETAATLINARATAMSKVHSGSMSAIIGLSEVVLKEIIEEVSQTAYIDIANYNTPEQTVITGEKDAIEKANELALAKGAKRAITLAVSGAFHSKKMLNAAKEFELEFNKANLSDAIIPVITNIDGLPTIKADDFKIKMPKQIYSPVHWVQTLNYMKKEGVEHFIEIGPSKVLAGLAKRTLKDVKISAICKVEDLQKVTDEIFNCCN